MTISIIGFYRNGSHDAHAPNHLRFSAIWPLAVIPAAADETADGAPATAEVRAALTELTGDAGVVVWMVAVPETEAVALLTLAVAVSGV